MSSPTHTPNLLAEAIGIADGMIQMPVHEGHLRALMHAIPATDARHYLNNEKRCMGCQEWKPRDEVLDCETCPDNYCAECKADHGVYCK